MKPYESNDLLWVQSLKNLRKNKHDYIRLVQIAVFVAIILSIKYKCRQDYLVSFEISFRHDAYLVQYSYYCSNNFLHGMVILFQEL